MLAKKCLLVGIFALLSLSLATSAQPIHPTTGEPLIMDCLRGTPDAIDGDLSDWNLEAMTPAVLDVVEQVYSGQASWDNVADCSGEVYLLWDDVNIYIAAVVKDDKLSMNKTDASIWNSDCVEVFLSTTDAEASHSWTNPTIHYQYGFNANNQKWNWCNMDGPGQSEPDYLQIASSVTADGYILEASIEYAQMSSLDFSAGNTIGLHTSIDDTDVDNGDTEVFMTWTGLAPHDQSMGYGHVVLSADSVPGPGLDDSGRLIVPETSVAPVIDGELDDIWQNVGEEGVLITEITNATSAIPEDANDLSATFQVMYDDDNFYIYVVVQDSVLDYTFSDWQGDGVELFFDGDNSKGSSYDGVNDNQIRITVDDVELADIDSSLPVDGSDFKVLLTDVGYNIEASFPLATLQIVPESTFGFEVQVNDNDDGSDRETMIRWFSDDNNSWRDASLFGEALLVPAPEPVDPGIENLVAYYPLDNDANDASANNNHGTLSGDPQWVSGAIGEALEFDGIDDHVDCGNDPSLDITGPITIGAWVYPIGPGSSSYPRIVDKSDGTGGADPGYKLYLRSAQDYLVTLSAGGVFVNSSISAILNDWNYVAFVTDGTQRKLFLNGIWEVWDESALPVSSSNPLFLGDSPAGSRPLNGIIDEVTIYNRALSEPEVRYLAGEREVDPSLVMYYSFDEVGEIVADQSGNGHDGVVVGDVTAEANGMYGGAASFANGGYLDLDGPNYPAEDIPTSAMTLTAWIKCVNTGGDHEIFNARASDSTWILHPEPKSSGDIRWLLRSYGSTTIFQIRAGTMTWDEWLHFAGTYDKESGKAALYINGELIEEMDVENPADIAGDWGLGARVGLTIDDARPFSGLMDEFRMYTRALSQDEILDIMQGM